MLCNREKNECFDFNVFYSKEIWLKLQKYIKNTTALNTYVSDANDDGW